METIDRIKEKLENIQNSYSEKIFEYEIETTLKTMNCFTLTNFLCNMAYWFRLLMGSKITSSRAPGSHPSTETL